MARQAIDVQERESLASLASKNETPVDDDVSGYVLTQSPREPKDLEAGQGPNIYSKKHIGLLVQYFSAGLVYSCVYRLIYPFLNNYLRMSGVTTSSVSVLTAFPYTCKFFFGIVSDCFPIFGFRRRPYIAIGMAVCTICCLVMAVLPTGDPYYPDPSLAYVNPAKLTQEQKDSINYDAPNSGTAFVCLLILANMGIVVAGAAIGGVLVEFSQQEPEAVRGKAQTMIWAARYLGSVGASALVGFGLNSRDFGGTFGGSIGVNSVMGICAVVSLGAAISSWYNNTETKVVERLSFRGELRKMYELMHSRVVYQIVLFQFFQNMFSSVSVTASYPIQSVWAKVEPLNSSIAAIISSFIGIGTLSVVAKYGLGWNWRWIIVGCELGVIALDLFPTFFTVWDVFRNQWFWIGIPLLEKVPSSISFVISTYCMVEIAEKGNEAAFYGLLVSVSGLASPFSTVITKNVDANFDIGLKYLQVDDTHVRTQVTYAYLFQYACKIFSFVFLFLLPRQKAETRELKSKGEKSVVIGNLTIVMLVFVFIWSLMTNVMSIFPSTACLKVAGGTGC
ncbi:hypothetical protein Poli38472_011878 [Pythium oligandrum]|uniref:Transmembrane protein n=1 Tax=Pythium oligandrum TaxID=41045 RepID=A0A8K1FCG4_PYTOL|nr:hypothetical protein Poli38472_011878 [Pythium oligandrum]|eukprot:TMW58290.1 hypothetical protein Poli38472_011878 [Pythium oligandrum]